MDLSNIYYDRDIVKMFKRECDMFWKLAWVYRSNWRVLHIDGFDGYRFPFRTGSGKLRQFFSYDIPATPEAQ